MSDYVLTATRKDGEPIRLEFDKLADAEEVMEWARANPASQTLEIRGLGYPIAWFRRDGCQTCQGRAQVPDYDRWGNIAGIADCAECNGTGVVMPHTDSHSAAPPEALAVDCPLCHQPLPAIDWSEVPVHHDYADIPF